jgi:hypothetical protein
MGDALGPLVWAAVGAYWVWVRPRYRPAWTSGRLVMAAEVAVSLGLLYLGAVLAAGMIQRR